MKRYEEFYLATVVVGTRTKLAQRLNTSVDGLASTDALKKTITGIAVRCANTGILIISIDGNVVTMLDLVIANAQTFILPLDIPVPVGSKVSLEELTSSGTAVATALVQYDVG